MSTRLGSAAIITVAIHAALAAWMSTFERDDPKPPTVITIREAPKKKEPPPPPPPPPAPTPPPPAPAPAPAVKPPPPKPAPAKRAAPPPPAAATPAPSSAPAAPADFGVRLGNAGGNGPAVPAPPPPAETAPPPKPKTLAAAPAPTDGGCADPIVKPKPLQVVQPAFTQEAQDAGITGKVRVEITISKTGTVTAARVIEGLGHGLDEAALEAAKQSTFTPATKCGEPVETTFTIGMRFQR